MAKRRTTCPPIPFHLAQLMVEQGVTLQELMEGTGFGELTCCRLIRCDADPRWSLICKIAEVFGQEPEGLVSLLTDIHRENRRIRLVDPWPKEEE